MKEEYDLLKEIKKDEGTLNVEIMSDDMKKQVLAIEMDRSKEIIPVINEGLNDAFKEKEIAVIVKNNSNKKVENNIIPLPSLTLLTESGKLIGEEIYDEEELENLHQREDVYFVSDNFVTYTNVKSAQGEKQFFKVSSLNNNLLDNQDINKQLDSLIIALPSIHTNYYIKEHYGYKHEDEIGTIIIGFTPKNN